MSRMLAASLKTIQASWWKLAKTIANTIYDALQLELAFKWQCIVFMIAQVRSLCWPATNSHNWFHVSSSESASKHIREATRSQKGSPRNKPAKVRDEATPLQGYRKSQPAKEPVEGQPPLFSQPATDSVNPNPVFFSQAFSRILKTQQFILLRMPEFPQTPKWACGFALSLKYAPRCCCNSVFRSYSCRERPCALLCPTYSCIATLRLGVLS